MTAVLDIDHAFFIHFRADIVITFRNQCQRSEDIDRRYCFCGLLNAFYLFCDLFPYIGKQIVFQRKELVLRSENDVLQLFNSGVI